MTVSGSGQFHLAILIKEKRKAMKSQARQRKRMEARRQELLREMENRKRIWNAAMSGDAEASKFLLKQYLAIKDEL